jgi:DinB superfamily
MTNQAAVRPLTPVERDNAAKELSASYQALLETVQCLTPDQWNFRTAPMQWCIADCVEHLAVSEAAGLARYERMLAAGATPGKTSPFTDEQLGERVADRTEKFTAPEVIAPARRWSDPIEALNQLKENRDKSIAQIQNSRDDLRAYFSAHLVFGDLDAFQWARLRAAHTARHTAQIREIMSHPAYPAAIA